ncbi:MAG: hypothetical protein ABSG88_21205 [Bradyrhizobium sp.]
MFKISNKKLSIEHSLAIEPPKASVPKSAPKFECLNFEIPVVTQGLLRSTRAT